jgi:tRNA(Ile)-lysidine synthase
MPSPGERLPAQRPPGERNGAQALAARFRDHVTASGGVAEGDLLLVALSGGADSVVLLHLLRFTPGLPGLRVAAAHVDHAMRGAAAAADARWVEGLCLAWGVPLRVIRLDPAPRDEAEARRRRYAALEEVRREVGAGRVLTAHHADDQAETVLFRALRGTGISGLRGIHERRAPRVWRPLLPFTRDELRAYAARHRLSWREDATNRDPLPRNVLRTTVLPELEASVAPGARRALAGLARRAAWDEAAWRSLERGLLRAVGVRREEEGYSLDREALAAYHPAVRARILRALARRLGAAPGETGTRQAVAFTSSGSGGGSVRLGSGLVLRLELDRVRLAREAVPPPDVEATVEGPGPGSARILLGGARWEVRWGPGILDVGGESVSLPLRGLRFPLAVRGWRAGDRVRLGYGSKKLKKLFLEERVPARERHRTPVVADAGGQVLWVPGVARSADARPDDDEDVLTIEIIHAPPE